MKLPDQQSLGNPITPEATNSVASYNNAEAPAAAMFDLGKMTNQAGENLQNIVDRANTMQAINAYNTGAAQLGGEFYSKQGAAAVTAGPAYIQSLNDLSNKLSATLPTNQAQDIFKQNTAAHIGSEQYRAAQHAGQQAIAYSTQTQQASSDLNLAAYGATRLSDPNTAMSHFINDQLQLKNHLTKDLGIPEDSPIVQDQLNALSAKYAAVDEKALMGLPLDQRMQMLHPSQGITAPNSAIYTTPEKVPLKTLQVAFNQQESGNNPESPTSIDGAMGKEQIIPATFQQYAKPGESINNPDDRAAVQTRMLNDYYQKYDGDARRVAVAYFSGPGNVAPANSPTPWLKDVSDGNGKSVSSYVNDMDSRLGTSGNAGTPDNIAIAANPTVKGVPIAPALADKFVKGTLADQAQAVRLEREQGEANDRKLQSDFIPKIANNTATASDILAAKFYNPELQQKLLDQVRKGPGETDEGLYTGLVQRVLAPAGDPKKITDPSTLVPLIGHGLSAQSYDDLSSRINGNKSPEGKNDAKLQTDMLANAKAKLVQGTWDKDGEDKYSAFVSWALPQWDKMKAAGKNPADMANPDSPDSLLKAVPAFDRPAAQRIADSIKDPMQYQAPRTATDVVIDMTNGKVTAQAGRQELINMAAPIKEQIAAGTISKEEGRQQMIKLGLISK